MLQEDLSIGVDDGAPEEMFGPIRSLAVAPDGAIYVMDPEPAPRKFDRTGACLATFGRLGSGPGEYPQPDGGLTVLADGRVVVRDPSNGRFQLFTPTGEPAGTWPATTGFNTSRQLGRDTAGNVYAVILLETNVDPRDWKLGIRRLDATGATHDTLAVPEWEFERMEITGQREGNSRISDVPFSPRAPWAWSPLGYFVGGVSDRYRIDLLRPGGVLRLEREVAIRVLVTHDSRLTTRDYCGANRSRNARSSAVRLVGPPARTFARTRSSSARFTSCSRSRGIRSHRVRSPPLGTPRCVGPSAACRNARAGDRFSIHTR